MVKGFPLESAYHSEKLSQPGMLLLEHRVWFFNSYDSTTPFCPWWRRSYGISFFFFWQIGVRASFGECPFHTIPAPIPFSSTVHLLHSWGRCLLLPGTNPNEFYLLFAGQCLPFIGRSSFHGLFWDTPGVPKRLRNRCLSSSPWVALVLTLRKLASACRSHWSLLLHFELFRFFLDEGPMIQNWVCRGPSNRRGGPGELAFKRCLPCIQGGFDLLKWKGSCRKNGRGQYCRPPCADVGPGLSEHQQGGFHFPGCASTHPQAIWHQEDAGTIASAGVMVG